MGVVVQARSFLVARGRLTRAMLEDGKRVHTERWQGMDITRKPDLETVELLNAQLHLDLRGIDSLNHWRQEIQPNLPWADEHFEERVSGEPLNPPPSWVRWPWALSADKFRKDTQFNHTYPERFWPKYANGSKNVLGGGAHMGIRWQYGDLDDVVDLLVKEPLTRQAYLPMFFPEDTGIGDGGRKPCTLGYQFILRDGLLHIYYPMRSCDFVRHFADDVYFAVRLGLWVRDECGKRNTVWLPSNVRLGTLTMHMTSLHCFVNDYEKLKSDAR